MATKVVDAVLVGAVAAISVCWSGYAHAQIGTGWTEYTPAKRVQTRGCGAHSAADGVETFRLTCAASSGDNRAEERIENDYTSGSNQFEGEFRLISLGGSNVSVKQTFMPNNGAFLMIAIATGGRLYSVGDSNADLATGIMGRWVKLNTLHDVAAGTHEMWIDGVLRFIKRGGRQVAWHDKYGTYRLGSGQGPITVEWRNVKYYRGGRSPGGTPTPPRPADGGAAPDGGGADVLPAPDASGGPDAAGGSSGTGGAGGSGGSGGAGGSGGSGGSGGGGGSGGTGGSSAGGTGGTGGSPGSSGTGGTGGSGGQSGRGGSAGRGGASASGGAGGTGGSGGSSGGGCALAPGIAGRGTAPLAGAVVALLLIARRRRAIRTPR
jgi:hypothetical protein